MPGAGVAAAGVNDAAPASPWREVASPCKGANRRRELGVNSIRCFHEQDQSQLLS